MGSRGATHHNIAEGNRYPGSDLYDALLARCERAEVENERLRERKCFVCTDWMTQAERANAENERLRMEVMQHWRGVDLAGDALCHFCGAFGAVVELVPHDDDCIVRAILVDAVRRNVADAT